LRAGASRSARPASTIEEHPIFFTGPNVRAIRAGHKTQTRRPIRGAPNVARSARFLQPLGERWHGWAGAVFFAGPQPTSMALAEVASPYGAPSDRLWVRETWALVPRTAYAHSASVEQVVHPINSHDAAIFRAHWDLSPPSRWRPSIHMPRWACRMRLELLVVRVERLQQITEADAIAEGVDRGAMPIVSARYAYAQLWNSLYTRPGERWADNPWVWVLEFVEVQA
jgi:hypothetical protein